jgi:hypothetical protein
VQGRQRHGRRPRSSRRRRRRHPRNRQAADEDLDGDVVGGDKLSSEKLCHSDLQFDEALVVESRDQGCAVVMLTKQRTYGLGYSSPPVFEAIAIIEAHDNSN